MDLSLQVTNIEAKDRAAGALLRVKPVKKTTFVVQAGKKKAAKKKPKPQIL